MAKSKYVQYELPFGLDFSNPSPLMDNHQDVKRHKTARSLAARRPQDVKAASTNLLDILVLIDTNHLNQQGADVLGENIGTSVAE